MVISYASDFYLSLSKTLLDKLQKEPHKYAKVMLDIPKHPKRIPKHLKEFLNPMYDNAVLHNFRFIKYFRKLALIDATHRLKQKPLTSDKLNEVYDEILKDATPVESYLDVYCGELFSRYFEDIKKQMPEDKLEDVNPIIDNVSAKDRAITKYMQENPY